MNELPIFLKSPILKRFGFNFVKFVETGVELLRVLRELGADAKSPISFSVLFPVPISHNLIIELKLKF